MKIIFTVLLGLIWAIAPAAETNLFYVTDDGFLVHQTKDGQISMNPQRVEVAKKARESLPASEYPEGNWGTPQNGFQLSMRLNQHTFTNGEPIVATILLRNVTNLVLTFPEIDILGGNGPINLTVLDVNGKSISDGSTDITVVSAHDETLFRGTQRKFTEDLSSSGLETNQTYRVYANIRVLCPRCVELESAKVPIIIK
jgi:hypothetical protein